LWQVISDIRGLDKILKVPSAPAYFGCHFCWIHGFKACKKTTYCGHHTSLPATHPLRQELADLLAKKVAATPTKDVNLPLEASSSLVPAPRTSQHLQEGEIIFI
jgi:hypothetical protein